MDGELTGEIVAIVPAYNEEGNVGRVVREISSKAPFVDVVVVDDGSKDRTATEAREAGAAVLSLPANYGIGCAMITGMTFALEEGYRMAVQVDGDGQHDPSEIYELLAPVLAGDADVVIGSRFLGQGGYRPPWHRRLGMLLLAAAVRLATGTRVTDTTSGFRAMNRRALGFLVENYPEDYPEPESIVLMHLGGIRFTEVQVEMRSRVNGASSIKNLSSVYFMTKVLACIALDASRIKVPEPVPGEVS